MFEVPYMCFLIKIINIKNYKAEKMCEIVVKIIILP